MPSIKKLLKNPYKIIFLLDRSKITNLISDELYLKWKYRAIFGKKLNLKNPQTFNEKLQWLKLHDRNPEYVNMVDKFTAKKIAGSIIGDEYIIPTIGVWDNVDEIDFESLPEQFVLKCTHDSGGVVVCNDKDKLDIDAAKKKLRKAFKTNYFYPDREWPYKKIKPRIIAEEYMESESGDLPDYKFFCFDGVPKAMFVATDRATDVKFDFYDIEFNHLPFVWGHEHADKDIPKPKGFELMKELASKLSQGIPHVRVDFYDVNGKVYFGEMTFYHWSGICPFEPEEWDYKFGEYIDLNIVKEHN